MDATFLHAADREAGVLCPHCGIEVVRGDAVAQCKACATVHHESCWALHGCGAYSCAPARRETGAPTTAGAVWRISAEDLRNAKPMRAAVAIPGVRFTGPSMPLRPKTSRLAVAALVCAIAGIPLFGVITGIVAVVLASLALMEISKDNRKGKAMAYTGLFLGLADAAGWVFLLAHLLGGSLGGGGRTSPRTVDFRLDPHQLEALPAPIARAMRANVLLTGHHGIAGEIVGSGIILRIADGKAEILTNRHVVDPSYDADSSTADFSGLKPLEVALVDQSISQGRVIWLAPGAVDLALVSAPCVSAAARAAAWPATRPSVVSDSVFAIGNPHAWGWTHTQGTISQFRMLAARGDVPDVHVIQTSAPINPGNSGGGLYDRDGFLIGVNTWTNDKRVSEGLSFSIALDTFLGMSPPVSKEAADRGVRQGQQQQQQQQEKRP